MCNMCDWEDTLITIGEMMDDPDYKFAYDTLSSIADWIEENQHITDQQIKAVENIRDSIP